MSDTGRSDADILRAAKARIADQGHFVAGTPAWTRDGRMVDPTSPEAWRWNARGAIHAESGIRPTPWQDRGTSKAQRLYDLLDAAVCPLAEEAATAPGMQWLRAAPDPSDNLGHALTLQAFDDAIALAESGEVVSHD